jgi:hypothetical protein
MTATPPTGFSAVPLGGEAPLALKDAAGTKWVKRLAETINRLLQGKLNASLAVTLASGATSTTVKDARIGAFSTLVLVPLTAHAAALLYAAPYVLTGAQQSGQVTFSHANTANTDQTFNLLIIG